MDEGNVLALITACGPRLWLHMKTTRAYSTSIRSEYLGPRSRHEYLKKKKKSPRAETPGGQEW